MVCLFCVCTFGLLTSGAAAKVLFSWRFVGSTIAKIFIEMFTRNIYDMKHAINSITPTLKRVGIFSGIK